MASNIVEILKVASASRQTFTINSGVTEVDIDIGASVRYLESVSLFGKFKRFDSALILEAGLMLPYAFQLSTEPLYMSMDWYNDAGTGTAPAASFTLPGGICSISFAGGSSPGLFLPHPGIADPTWTGKARLALSVIVGKVSMVNLPSALSGSLKVIPWVRVQHNFALEV